MKGLMAGIAKVVLGVAGFFALFGIILVVGDKLYSPAKPTRSDAEVDARMRAIDLCEAYVTSVANHPETVDFSRFLDLSVDSGPNGITVRSSFTAQNSFGAELKSKVRCLVKDDELVHANVQE